MNKKERSIKEGKYNHASGPMPTNIVKQVNRKKPTFRAKPTKMIRSG